MTQPRDTDVPGSSLKLHLVLPRNKGTFDCPESVMGHSHKVPFTSLIMVSPGRVALLISVGSARAESGPMMTNGWRPRKQARREFPCACRILRGATSIYTS